jgi:subtilase family serine protease
MRRCTIANLLTVLVLSLLIIFATGCSTPPIQTPQATEPPLEEPTPAAKPDLIVEKIWVGAGNSIYYKIKNQGTVQAGASISVMGVPEGNSMVNWYDTVDPLEAGASSTQSFIGYSYPYSHRPDVLVIGADAYNVVDESDENNNGNILIGGFSH